jgi:hypothetical protein
MARNIPAVPRRERFFRRPVMIISRAVLRSGATAGLTIGEYRRLWRSKVVPTDPEAYDMANRKHYNGGELRWLRATR